MDQVPGVNITDGQTFEEVGWSYGASRVLVMVDDMPLISGDAWTSTMEINWSRER